MDGGTWWAAVHGVAKSWTWLSNFPFTFHCHALEKEMATHSSVLAWRIPGTGEPGGLPDGIAESWTLLKQLSSSSSRGEARIELIKSSENSYLKTCSVSFSQVTGVFHSWSLPWIPSVHDLILVEAIDKCQFVVGSFWGRLALSVCSFSYWPQVSCFVSAGFSFLICEMGLIVALP